jgi:hypothetical protein
MARMRTLCLSVYLSVNNSADHEKVTADAPAKYSHYSHALVQRELKICGTAKLPPVSKRKLF